MGLKANRKISLNLRFTIKSLTQFIAIESVIDKQPSFEFSWTILIHYFPKTDNDLICHDTGNFGYFKYRLFQREIIIY